MYTQITIPGAVETDVDGINSLGDIVGTYNTVSANHGFLLKNGVLENIDCQGNLQTQYTVLTAVNDSDMFLGVCQIGTRTMGFYGTP